MDDSCISILVENYYAESILDLSVAMGTLLDKGQARGVESRDVITGREAEVEIWEDDEELSRTIKSKYSRKKDKNKERSLHVNNIGM